MTIHNMRRLQSGLNGKYDVNPEAADSRETDKGFVPAVVSVEEVYEQGEGWQDKGEFEREQSVEIGEIGGRDSSHGMMGKSQTPYVAIDGTTKVIDKMARKKAKKEKRKQYRAEKE